MPGPIESNEPMGAPPSGGDAVVSPEEVSDEGIRFLELPFQRLALEPDDLVVVTVKRRLSVDAIESLQRELKPFFGERKVLVLFEGVEIGAIGGI